MPSHDKTRTYKLALRAVLWEGAGHEVGQAVIPSWAA